MANPWQHHRFGRSIYRHAKRKWLFLVANSNSLRKTTLGSHWVKPEDQQENIICIDKCLVFPRVVHCVNREETSKEHIIPLLCLYFLAQSAKLKESVSVLLGRDWLKYRNKVRSEIVVIGVNR